MQEVQGIILKLVPNPEVNRVAVFFIIIIVIRVGFGGQMPVLSVRIKPNQFKLIPTKHKSTQPY